MPIDRTLEVNKLLRLPQVKSRTGLSRSEIYRRIRAGQFPPNKRLSHKVAVWRAADVDAWIFQEFVG